MASASELRAMRPCNAMDVAVRQKDKRMAELSYGTGAGLGSEFIAVSLGLGAVIEVKARRTLFPVADMVTATPHRNWDVSPDGRSFAMVRFNPATRVMVIQQLPVLARRLQGAGH